MNSFIISKIKESISVKSELMDSPDLIEITEQVSNIIVETFRQNGKVLFCGNGGSAADAQHLAAEFSGRFYIDRAPLDAEALHVNTSYLTAVANDYSYEEIYARLVKAKGSKGDVLIGLSTSGNSKNILQAFKQAKELGMITVALTGKSGGAMKDQVDYLINAPSGDTPRIQESHILVGHIICEIVERELFVQKND